MLLARGHIAPCRLWLVSRLSRPDDRDTKLRAANCAKFQVRGGSNPSDQQSHTELCVGVTLEKCASRWPAFIFFCTHHIMPLLLLQFCPSVRLSHVNQLETVQDTNTTVSPYVRALIICISCGHNSWSWVLGFTLMEGVKMGYLPSKVEISTSTPP